MQCRDTWPLLSAWQQIKWFIKTWGGWLLRLSRRNGVEDLRNPSGHWWDCVFLGRLPKQCLLKESKGDTSKRIHANVAQPHPNITSTSRAYPSHWQLCGVKCRGWGVTLLTRECALHTHTHHWSLPMLPSPPTSSHRITSGGGATWSASASWGVEAGRTSGALFT